jgi:peptidoglycan/LPS O-acetylase OafA/YrhL
VSGVREPEPLFGADAPQGLAETRGYRPQLDALRAFAVVGVLITHFWQPGELPWIFRRVDFGFLGVRLFFVLSGFLITRILLEGRDGVEERGQGRFSFIRQFYARRFLRIFPIYYLIVALALIVNLPPAREIWPWLVTYTSNFYSAFTGQSVRYFGHFWTLAVEEQFYLVWPWAVLYVARRRLPLIIALAIGVAIIYRDQIVRPLYGEWGTLPFASLDTLGAGALLAMFLHRSEGRERRYRTLQRIVLPVGLIGYLALNAVTYRHESHRILFALHETAYAMFCCWLIASADRGIRGVAGRMLSLKPLVYVGRISYGIYAYHFFIPWVLARAFGQVGRTLPDPGASRFVLASIATVAVAGVSWHLFEGPINRLKARFPYSGIADAPVVAAGSLHRGAV